MNLNTQIDKSLEQIIKDNRPMTSKRANKPRAKASAAESAKPRRRSKNKSTDSDAIMVDAFAGRLGSTSRVSAGRVAAGRLAGRVGKATAGRVGKSETRRVTSDSGRLSGRIGKSAINRNTSIESGRLSGRIGTGASARLAGLAERKKRASEKRADETPRNLNITIKGEAGPATVFISNLDAEATPEDVKTCFKQFGAIRACTLLYDRTGKASGHAEVTYMTKVAAEEAAAKLNNVLADGRRLSVRLMPPSQTQRPSVAPFAAQPKQAAQPKARKQRRGGRMDID
ncbi:hypothetical protein LPJ77_002710 [Coemansia sp. RSA 2523]|nr:hypothetical protein LPJ58_003916 [Coemansia sp. RSA 1591]KAJ1807910.1 hypothetical protein LPJ77_002710 [Coemansia sp. RSA 2523]KAJ2573766.1 hypothetical protein GGH19_004338 [Coemansia sp. RSA 1807]